jgi:hypothetical protein
MLLVVSIKAKGECDVSKISCSLYASAMNLTLLVLWREAINKFITKFCRILLNKFLILENFKKIIDYYIKFYSH